MALGDFHRVTRATKQAFVVGPDARRYAAIALLGTAVLGAVGAHAIPTMSGHVPKVLVVAMGLAGASILLTLSARHLFFMWLFLAPLLQESAQKNRMGHLLSLALYTAPPLVAGVKVLVDRGWRPRREWFDFVPAIYVAFILASLVITDTGAIKSGTVGTLRGVYQTVALGPLVYYIVAFWRGRRLSPVRICWIVLAAAALQAVMAVIEWRSGWNLWHDMSWQHGDVRSIATLTNPAVTGAFIGVGIVIALAVLSWAGPAELRRLAIVMLVVGLPGLYATKTRGPILATLVASLACLLLSSRSRVLGLGVIVVSALTLLVFWPQIRASSTYQNRFDQTQNVDARLVLQKVSIKLAEERPVLGWGYDSFDRVKYKVPVSVDATALAAALQSTSHDTFLTMIVEFGAVGLFVFVLPWALVLWRAVRRARIPGPDRWVLVAGIASIAVVTIDAGTLDFRFYSFLPALAWMFLGLLRRELVPDEVTEPALLPSVRPAASTA